MSLICQPVWKLTMPMLLLGVFCLSSCESRKPVNVSGDTTTEHKSPVARVQTAPVKREVIQETLVAYGTVIAALGESRTFSVPFESRVVKVLVADGQPVNKDSSLVVIEPSPETQLQMEEATNEREAAKNGLDLTKERSALKLATRTDLAQAEERFHSAETRLKNLAKRGIDGVRKISAEEDGLVGKVQVQQGQIVSAGAPLLDTIGEDQLTVRLGIEHEDVPFIKMGQRVTLESVNTQSTRSADGHVALITREINPDTRLVDVFVTPATGTSLLLNEYIRASIVIASTEGLTVPRSAVLPGEKSSDIFSVKNGYAVEHHVGVGIENQNKVQIIGKDIGEGQQVVVTGNSELDDGMAVKVVDKQ